MMAEIDVRKLTNDQLMTRIGEDMSRDDDYVESEEDFTTSVSLLEEVVRRAFDGLGQRATTTSSVAASLDGTP